MQHSTDFGCSANLASGLPPDASPRPAGGSRCVPRTPYPHDPAGMPPPVYWCLPAADRLRRNAAGYAGDNLPIAHTFYIACAPFLILMDKKSFVIMERKGVQIMENKRKKGTPPPRYDDAFKAGAVRMVTEQGRPSACIYFTSLSIRLYAYSACLTGSLYFWENLRIVKEVGMIHQLSLTTATLHIFQVST